MISFRQLVEDWPEGSLTKDTIAHRLTLLSEHPGGAGFEDLMEAAREVRERHGGRMSWDGLSYLDRKIKRLSSILGPEPQAATEAA